jgi:hypothetical protein
MERQVEAARDYGYPHCTERPRTSNDAEHNNLPRRTLCHPRVEVAVSDLIKLERVKSIGLV